MEKKAKTIYYLSGETAPKADKQEEFEIIKMSYEHDGRKTWSTAFKELIYWYWFEN